MDQRLYAVTYDNYRSGIQSVFVVKARNKPEAGRKYRAYDSITRLTRNEAITVRRLYLCQDVTPL